MERTEEGWVSEVEKVSKFAVTQPHCSLCYLHSWPRDVHYSNQLEVIQSHDPLESLERDIQSCFIPALTGKPPSGQLVHKMLALSGLDLVNSVTSANEPKAASQMIRATLARLLK